MWHLVIDSDEHSDAEIYSHFSVCVINAAVSSGIFKYKVNTKGNNVLKLKLNRDTHVAPNQSE